MPIYGDRLISDLRANWTPLPGEEIAADRKSNASMAKFKDLDLIAAVEAVFPGGLPEKHPLDATVIGLMGYWSGVRNTSFGMESHTAEGHRMAILYALQSLAPRAEAERIWQEAQRIDTEMRHEGRR